MAELRKVASGMTAVAVPIVPVVLWVTGRLHVRADAVTAWATWVTAAIALGAAVVGLNQVREVRRTREEQAQPNVVLYNEPNADVPQILEIIVENFGMTPAYDVKVKVTPPIKSTPALETINKIADVPIPDFPILAPGQRWSTVWDAATTRNEYMRKLQREYDKGEWATCEFRERALFPRHEAVITYTDSRKRDHETRAFLDFGMREGTMFAYIKTIHDLTKMLEKHLDKHNDGMVAIHRRLAEFGTEHEGIWIYGSGDDGEREHRRQIAVVEAERRRRFDEATALGRLRRQARQPQQTDGGSAEDGTDDDGQAGGQHDDGER